VLQALFWQNFLFDEGERRASLQPGWLFAWWAVQPDNGLVGFLILIDGDPVIFNH
jgi:hypothetical protein